MVVPADKLITKFDRAEAKLIRKLFADEYRIVVKAGTPDGEGGQTTADTFTETGRCLLQRGQSRGAESATGVVVIATADYIAQFPSTTVVEATNRVEINGDEYNVTTVKPTGHVGVFTTVELERVS